jgi:parvulin-like peptidyl-prolyl isomerase
MRVVCSALCFLFFHTFGMPQDSYPEEKYVGKAGDEFISEREFKERFELTPGLYSHRKSKLEEDKDAFLYSLVAEKLLAQEALARNLDRDSIYQKAMLDLTKMLARDELYAREIKGKVEVNSDELRRGMLEARRELRVRYLFFEKEEDAQFVRGLIKRPAEFDRIQVDSSIKYLADTATVIWGDADAKIESSSYKLKYHEISPVIHAGDGFYILKLIQTQPDEFYSKMGPDVFRERVESKIRRRKEIQRVSEFLHTFQKVMVAYSPPQSFQRFARHLEEALKHHPQTPQVSLTESTVNEVIEMEKEHLQDTLIVAGSRCWRAREVIETLTMKGFSIPQGKERNVSRRLYNEFREWVDEELMSQEALRRGFDRSQEVQHRLEPWRDQYLAAMMKRYVYGTVTASENEALQFMKAEGRPFSVRQVKIRELHTKSVDAMKEAILDLERGSPFTDVVGKFSSDPEERKRHGETDFFSISDRPSIGEVAWQMDVGKRYGPMSDSTGLVLFEVLAKKTDSLTVDSVAASKYEHARQELLSMKRKRKLTLFLAQTGTRRGFAIYQDRLEHLDVTMTPMLAFRFLGFGGRMFAAPFVDKQLEWLNVKPPEDVIVP